MRGKCISPDYHITDMQSVILFNNGQPSKMLELEPPSTTLKLKEHKFNDSHANIHN